MSLPAFTAIFDVISGKSIFSRHCFLIFNIDFIDIDHCAENIIIVCLIRDEK